MSLLQDFRESKVLGSKLRTTGALMVPRWEFFDGQVSQILEHIKETDAENKEKIGAVLDVGYGTGRLPETIIARRNVLAEDGLYIGVDCNPKSKEFIRQERPHLLNDKRVHLMQDYAQNVGDKLRNILNGRKLQATVVSFPHLWTPDKDVDAIWKMIADCSADDAMAIVYNVSSTRQRVAKHWHEIESHTERHAHTLWLPPWFEVNVLRHPARTPLSAENDHARGVNGVAGAAFATVRHGT